MNNFAFIDGNNLFLGVKALGWKIDMRRFRQYLKDQYGVTKAYYFIGFHPDQQNLYRSLQEAGFVLEFKPTLTLKDGTMKGNCDAELVLRTILEIGNYDNAVIVTGDGDFQCLVKHLIEVAKLEKVISPSAKGCSKLIKKICTPTFIEELRSKLEYVKH